MLLAVLAVSKKEAEVLTVEEVEELKGKAVVASLLLVVH
jgi:hypothetical protein